MRFVIGLGSVMYIDKQGNERFVPTCTDKETGLTYFDSEESSWADLGLVGDELTPDDITLYEYWQNIRKVVA